MFAGEVEWYVISVRNRVNACGSGKEKFDTVEVAVDNRMDQGSEVVVVCEIDRPLVC